MDNKENKDKKKAFNKMLLFKIFILLGYLLTFFALLFVVSRCTRDVSADVPQYYEMSYNSTDVLGTDISNDLSIKVDYFSPYDLLYNAYDTPVVFQNYRFVFADKEISLNFRTNYMTNGGFDLIVERSGSGTTYQAESILQWADNSTLDNVILMTGIRLWLNNSNQLRVEPVLYMLNNSNPTNSTWYNLENHRFTINNSTCSIISRSYNQFWFTSRFATDLDLGATTDIFTKYLSLINSTNAPNVEVVYRNEYLFGDLVSSFLNISFGNVVLGGNTYTFTLGLLLLFILGLGALFLVLKVMLGG